MEFVIIGVLTLLNWFFALTEIALVSVKKSKIDMLASRWNKRAKVIAKLLDNPESFLSSIQVGITLIGIIAGAYGGTAIAAVIVPYFVSFAPYAEEIAISVSIATITYFSIVIWELVPKTLAMNNPERFALFCVPILGYFMVLTYPFVKLLSISTTIILKVLWVKNVRHWIVSQEEIHAFIDMSHSSGAVEADERRQIKNLLSLPDTTAESVMTPRVNVEFLSLDMTIDDACTFFMRSSHSRIPIYGETPDDIDFVITFREAFKLQSEWLWSKLLSMLDLEKIMKVPVTQPLDDLFEKFQKSRRHIALVLDEHGWTAGVVTMEDVLEEVFGDIKDEKDKEDIYLLSKSDGKIEAVWTALIDDILEEYDIQPADIDLPEEYIGEPISYIIMAEKEAFPKENSRIQFSSSTHSLSLRVLSIDGTVIEKVECTKKEIFA